MMSSIKGALGILLKWGLIAIALVIAFKLVTTFVPALSQDSIKEKLNNNSNSINSAESPKKDFMTSLREFLTPNFNNAATTTCIKSKNSTVVNNSKYKAIQAPTLDYYIKRDTNIKYYNNGNSVSYDSDVYGAGDNSNTWGQVGTDWNASSTDWGAVETDWNKKQTNWDQGQTDWGITKTDCN